MIKKLLFIVIATFVLQAQCLAQSPFAKPKVLRTMPMNSEQGATDDNEPSINMMKLGPQKVINSISDLYGTWMVNYSNGSQQYFTVEIKAGLGSGNLIISGWWIGSLATDITASAQVAQGSGTLNIPDNQLVVNVDGYDKGYLVNMTNSGSPIKFNIYASGMSTSNKWAIMTTDGGAYENCTGMTFFKKCNGVMRYDYDGVTYTDPVLMGQNGVGGAAQLTLYNFFGLGTMMDNIVMKSDSTFEIPPTLLYVDSETGGRYYCYGTDGNSRWTIKGKGTAVRLTFDTNWSLCSPSTDEWIGAVSNTMIFYNDGTTFRYPDPVPESISLSITDADNQVVEPGDTYQLYATISPAGADQSVAWTSSDETVATVDENGLVTAVFEQSNGAKRPQLQGGGKTVTITATSVAKPELSASVRLYVGYPIDGLWGDVNNDGVVDVTDIDIVVSIVLGKYNDSKKIKR